MTINELIKLKETEDNIEFKEAKGGNFSYNGGGKADYKKRRRSILGYVIAFANQGGGKLVFGIADKHPHQVVGSSQNQGRIGELKQNIYRDLKISITTSELYDENKNRVLIIDIPQRPIGKFYTFEDVPLTRNGEELIPMSQEKQRQILLETESDFTAEICKNINIDDLDELALQKMKEKYAEKQRNEHFENQPNEQILKDLGLFKNEKLTYAALILLGKKEVIKENLPQNKIFHEYRHHNEDLQASKKLEFINPYYLLIDEIIETINLRNDEIKIEENNYYPSIRFFNQKVIREAINNAIAHRNYRSSGEIFIKQYPENLSFVNPGGFPQGVTLDNLLNVSVARNGLLADVLSKTEAVERSGQGIDSIYYNCIVESKKIPDYTKSDDFQVVLNLSGVIEDKGFVKFIKNVQNDRERNVKISINELITLNNIRIDKDKNLLDKSSLKTLQNKGLIETVGKTRNMKYILSKEYYSLTNQQGIYSSAIPLTDEQIKSFVIKHLNDFTKAKIGDFVELFAKFGMTREQTKNSVYKMVEQNVLKRSGEGFDTYYKLSK